MYFKAKFPFMGLLQHQSFFQNSSMNSITHNQKKEKNRKKCRKKLRGQIKFQSKKLYCSNVMLSEIISH